MDEKEINWEQRRYEIAKENLEITPKEWRSIK